MKGLGRLAGVPRRLPFTLGLLAVVGALAVATSGPGFVSRPDVVAQWGFALHKLWEGRLWTLVTATFLLHRPFLFPLSAAFVLYSVGVYEWTRGTRQALWVFGVADVAGSLAVALGIVLPLYLAGTSLGADLAFSDDVGVSGGAFGCLGAWMGRLPSRWRGVPLRRLALAGVGLYFAVELLVPGALEADLLHAIVFPLGLWLDRRLGRGPGDVSRDPPHDVGRRPTRDRRLGRAAP